MPRKLLPLLLTAIGCAPTPATKPPQRPVHEAPRSNPHPVASSAPAGASREQSWAAEQRRIPPAKIHRAGELLVELPFQPRNGRYYPLNADTIAYLDFAPGQYSGVRAIASRERVRRLEEPKALTDICVAMDGKATFAHGADGTLFSAPAFDAPMRAVGKQVSSTRDAFVVEEDGAKSFLDCRRGTIEKLGKLDGLSGFLYHEDAATVLLISTGKKRSCRVRAGNPSAWTDVPNCSHVQRLDSGLVQIFVQSPDKKTVNCSFVLDREGKRQPCNDKPGSAGPAAPPQQQEERLDFSLARFVAQDRVAIAGQKGLYLLPTSGKRADLKLVAPGSCDPLLPASPVFRCISEDRQTLRVVALDADGKARDELTLPIRGDEAQPPFFMTTDGGLATGGECNGTLSDAACVRQPDGTWKTIRFAADLVTALHRTAPGTMLLPTVSGELFVGTGTSDNILGGGPIQILVYKADKGLTTRIEKVPTWVLGDMAGLNGLIGDFLGGGRRQRGGPSFLWRSATTVSAWPLTREHPAFRTAESCRFDVALDGSTDARCVQGKVVAAGRFGLWEKKRGEVLETRDAGETWSPITLPEGVDTHDIECAAIGCRIGPYFQLGWGR